MGGEIGPEIIRAVRFNDDVGYVIRYLHRHSHQSKIDRRFAHDFHLRPELLLAIL